MLFQETYILNCIFQLTLIMTLLLQSSCIQLLPSFLPVMYLSESLFTSTWIGRLLMLSKQAAKEFILILCPWEKQHYKVEPGVHMADFACLKIMCKALGKKRGRFLFLLLPFLYPISYMCASLLKRLGVNTNCNNTNCLNNLQYYRTNGLLFS